MYFVQCPKCQQRMKVKEELHKVKVRCAHCKEIFLAETEEVSDSPAPAGAQSAPPSSRPAAPRPAAPAAASKPKAPKPSFEPQAKETVGIDLDSFAPVAPTTPGAAEPKAAPRVPRKKSNAPMFIVIGAGVLCILFAVIVIIQVQANKDRKEYSVKMPDGTEKMMSKAEYEDWVKQQDEAKTIPNAAPVNAARTGSVENTFFANTASRPASTNPFDDMPPGEGPNDISPENAKAMDSQLGEMPDKYKDKLQLTKNIVYPDDQDPKAGTIALEMQNTSDKKTIKTLVLYFQIINKLDGKERLVGRTSEVKLEYFPPSPAIMHYSVTYTLNAVGKYLKPVVSQLDYAPEGTVSWMVLDGFQIDPANELIKVTGHTKNETGAILRDPMVYGTFFNGRGEVLGSSAPVKLDDKTTLLKDASGRFALRFDKHKSIEDAKAVDIRVVGTKD